MGRQCENILINSFADLLFPMLDHRRHCHHGSIMINDNKLLGFSEISHYSSLNRLSASSVVFGGYSAKALASRIMDGGCKLVLTADGSFRGTKLIELKTIVDQVFVLRWFSEYG